MLLCIFEHAQLPIYYRRVIVYKPHLPPRLMMYTWVCCVGVVIFLVHDHNINPIINMITYFRDYWLNISVQLTSCNYHMYAQPP